MTSQITGCGVGLRFQHVDRIVDEKPHIPWLEILTDNYLLPGSVQQDYLLEIARHYPLTFHGVGMSLGSTDPLDVEYFQRVRVLADRVNPAWVSDHLCWTSVHGMVTHDLIPLPYTEETIRHVAARIRQAQDMLGRGLVIENVSSYLQYKQSVMPEWEFFCAVAEEADCGMLLDVNNIYVSACNHDFDPIDYLDAIPPQRVQEIHLAGYEDRGTHLLDTHGYPVTQPVWELYAQAIRRIGPVPTLIEWDNNVPQLETLLAEAAKASEVQARVLA
ncbi:MAG: DUF692 domain-containing protein [Gammaproteobacteria bacterium]|nr:DUF692 domain-containing protein [Gammaproteobacteria bacterium]MBU1723421.1 DUF692 domain-containing protein [Gammaproteobacteria bacterium]MBU2003786.1 DUF692 domain-containing protein [Gammaproteobacteria bacterium]